MITDWHEIDIDAARLLVTEAELKAFAARLIVKDQEWYDPQTQTYVLAKDAAEFTENIYRIIAFTKFKRMVASMYADDTGTVWRELS